MAITKINVNGTDYALGGSGGSGSAINAQMLCLGLDSYIVCNEGEIQEDDTFHICRYTNGINYQKRDAGLERYKCRYRGWVKLTKDSVERFGLEVVKTLTKTENGRDWWKVTLKGNGSEFAQFTGGALHDYESTIRQHREEFNDGGIPAHLDRKCGLSVERDGVRITDFLKFTVNYDDARGWTTTAKW